MKVWTLRLAIVARALLDELAFLPAPSARQRAPWHIQDSTPMSTGINLLAPAEGPTVAVTHPGQHPDAHGAGTEPLHDLGKLPSRRIASVTWWLASRPPHTSRAASGGALLAPTELPANAAAHPGRHPRCARNPEPMSAQPQGPRTRA